MGKTRTGLIALPLFALIAAGSAAAQQPKQQQQVIDVGQDAYKQNIQKLMEATRQQAKILTDRHASISAAIDQILKDKNAAEVSRTVDETYALAEAALKLYAPTNPIWAQHAELLKVVEDHIKEVQANLTTDIRYAQLAREYERRRDELNSVRTDLLTQRETAAAKLDKVKGDRDLIKHLLRLAQIDNAIAELKSAANEMKGLVDALDPILKKLDGLNVGS
jgi:hypothetical protein